MFSVKAHFNGSAIVLDEPAALEVGQVVQVIVDPKMSSSAPKRRSLAGFAKGTFEMRDDFNDPLPDFADYQ
jgi:hypothetical protein